MYADVARLRATLERGEGGLPEQDTALPTSWPDEVLQRHLVDAQQIVDSRLGAITRVPLDPVPDLVAGLAVDIAAYRAWLSFVGSSDLLERDPFVLRYRDAMQLLADIVDGKAVLPPSPDGGAAGGGVINPYDGNLFGPGDFGLGQMPPGAERRFGGW